MERLSRIIIIVAIVIVFTIGWHIGCNFGRVDKNRSVQSDTIIMVIHDTIVVRVPQAVRSENIGVRKYQISKKDSVLKADISNSNDSTDSEETDSVSMIELPITQSVYEDSLYRAYVSGFDARMDSLILYPRSEMVTITKHPKPKRWSVGVQMGYGMTLKGTPQFAPYFGVGVSYRVF